MEKMFNCPGLRTLTSNGNVDSNDNVSWLLIAVSDHNMLSERQISLPVPVFEAYSLLSSSVDSGLYLVIWSRILCGVRDKDLVSFTHSYLVFWANLLNILSFLQFINLDFFVKNQVALEMWNYIWNSNSIQLTTVSVFVPELCCLYCYGSVV